MFLLPFYFMGDFASLLSDYKDLSEPGEDGAGPAKLRAGDRVNHYAHVGGFSAGILFHLLVSAPIRRK